MRKPTIADQLLGEVDIDPFSINSLEDAKDAMRIRHDLVHAIICEVRCLRFGERTVESVIEESKSVITDLKYYELVRKQTPDFFEIRGSEGSLIEISVSRSKAMESEKVSKYSLLVYFMKLNGIKINTEIIVINPDFVLQKRDVLISVHKLNDESINAIKKICDNYRSLESQVKSMPHGSDIYMTLYGVTEELVTPIVSDDMVKDIFETSENKPFFDLSDLEKIINEPITSYVNSKDDKFIDDCVNMIPSIEPELMKTDDCDENYVRTKVDEESRRLDGELQTKYRSVFPLPYFNLNGSDAMDRSTETDLVETVKIAGKMFNSDDPVMASFGKCFLDHQPNIISNDDFPFECRLSKDLKKEIALEGPNRKSYAKRPDQFPEHFKKQKEYTMYSLSYDTDVSQLEKVLWLFSERQHLSQTHNIYDDCEMLSDMSGVGLDYVRLCQSVYREVNINSLRKDRRKKHILKPTGIQGLYVLIFKGPKLRVGEMPSQIWFKVIIDKDFYVHPDIRLSKWVFKRIIDSVTILHSHWVSADAHRLDHYLRCYDKIVMSYFSVTLMRFRSTYEIRENQDPESNSQVNKGLIESVNNDTTNTLGWIISVYMEDRRSTSKLLQNVRYLVMTSISIYKYYKSVIDKCIEPVRSPLQLYILKKMIKYKMSMDKFKISKEYHYGSVKYDTSTKTFQDAFGGASLRLPRPIVDDRHDLIADFSEILSEMYFTMLFNKNQDDPTHSSFQILSKMLEGEESMQEVKSQGNHLGYKKDLSDEAWADHVVNQKHSHQFSARAIEIGSKLVREKYGDKQGIDVRIAVSKKNINKTLDEFATYKSSAVNTRQIYSSTELKQNGRRRCIEGVIDLVNEGCYDSVEVANKYLKEPTVFQIFKKNQIGGVREILILTMISRIKINIIETISRNICVFDKRETLTHGSTKNELIKEALYEARNKPGKRMSLFFSMDKSRWGPSFVPIQFIYLFTPFKQQLGGYFNYILSQLILHQNKKCVLPERLIKAWAMDLDNKMSHRKDPRLQALKEHFIRTGEIFFMNESNMGQGILHYTSSYLHAAMISFRDELYRRACKKLSLDPDDHNDLFSSDDSFTVMSIEITRMSLVLKKIDIFMRCQEISERLFNCSTSKSKSSINPMIGEFNSLFMSNLTFFPTLIKFAIAAVHPVNTDSFFRMVKESFAASRQIVENGGTLDLFLVSHYMNKRYCEGIYHTHKGGQNDLIKLGVSKFPYQIGFYPIFNPTLMLMFGPEFYNYSLYKDFSNLNDDEQKLFINSHKIVKGGLVETMSELEEGETIIGGLLRIEASIGPIRQYQRIKRYATENLLTADDMKLMIMDDPLLIFRPTKTSEESGKKSDRTKTLIAFKIMHKIMIPGAKEAVKTITSSIYFGRMSGSVSAKAFYIPNHEFELHTYFDCIEILLHKEKPFVDIDSQIKFIYPKWGEYELFIDTKYAPIPDRVRHIMEIQTIRTLSIFKVGTNLYNSVFDVIQFLWAGVESPEHTENKFLRDIQILKTFYPMIKDTMEETLNGFKGDREQQIKTLILLLLKCYSLKDRVIKAIVYGPSTNDIKDTFYSVCERNTTIALTHLVATRHQELSVRKLNHEDLYLRYNHFILFELNRVDDSPNESFKGVTDEDIYFLMMDPLMGKQLKKRLLMALLGLGYIKDIESWTKTTSTILHYWEVRQRFNERTKLWIGDFELILFMGQSRMRVVYKSHLDKYYISKNEFDDPTLLYDMLLDLSDILNQKIDTIISRMGSGDWIVRDKLVVFSPKNGFDISNIRIPSTAYSIGCTVIVNSDVVTLKTTDGKKLLSVATGLINCSSKNTSLLDFNCFGLSFIKIMNMGVFNRGFDLSYKKIDEIRNLLDDLVVSKPEISDITRERLGIKQGWKIRDLRDDDLKENELEIESTQLEDPLSFFMINDEDLKEVSTSIVWDPQPVYEFVLEFNHTDFFNNMSATVDIQFPRRTLNLVKNLKYDCITFLTTLDSGVNKETMRSIRNVVDKGREFILFSLISRYDRIVASSGHQSPPEVILRLDKRLFEIGATRRDMGELFE